MVAVSNRNNVSKIPAAFAAQGRPPLIALVREVSEGGAMERYLAGAQGMAREFGMRLIELSAGGQQERMPDLIEQAMRERADAIVIDHGNSAQLHLFINQRST